MTDTRILLGIYMPRTDEAEHFRHVIKLLDIKQNEKLRLLRVQSLDAVTESLENDFPELLWADHLEAALENGSLCMGMNPDQTRHQASRMVEMVGASGPLVRKLMAHILVENEGKFDAVHQSIPDEFLESSVLSFAEDLLALTEQIRLVDKTIRR
ncbi:hypothetical protein FBU31_003913 [Coemansia sp. 'formosensis']|nr:hypothetical protein FBU31_003913 [Coemansia sp. 'formosensis']